MDYFKKMKQYEDVMWRTPRNAESPEVLRAKGVVPFKWESKPGQPKSLKEYDDLGNENETHEPRVVQLNLKASLMGVHILDDDEGLFFSRQSSMSSMISEKYRCSGAVPFKWEAEPGKPIEQPKTNFEISAAPLITPAGSIPQGGLLYSQPLIATGGLPKSGTIFPDTRSSRLPSVMLYPCANSGSRPSSSLLNVAHFTFADNILGAKGGTSGANNVTEKIFEKLVGQSRLQQCNTRGETPGRAVDIHSDFNIAGDDLSDSPVSTLDCPPSPTSSDRSFRVKSQRKSLRSRSEDANSVIAAQVGHIGPSVPRPKSQLAEYLMSRTAENGEATDDDDLEGPSEVAWHESEEQQYHPELPVVEGYTSVQGKSKPTHERWTSNSSSWNLSLVQKPLRTVSTIVGRSKHHHATVPGRSVRSGSRRSKDAIVPISLTTSYDGGSRVLKKGTRSELNSGRRWWPDLGSRTKNFAWGSSGRLQIEVAAEPDLHEPDMEQANNVNRLQQDSRAKVDEEDFPFDSPIASSFVFQEIDRTRLSDMQEPATRSIVTKKVVSELRSENEDLQLSDNYRDPDDASISGSEVSHSFSLEREAGGGLLDQPTQWVPARSYDYVKEVVDNIGLSSRALSGFLEIGRSGRFSIDLHRAKNLADDPRSPDVRLRIFKSEKSSRRSILSPCLPFLHRSHKHVPRIQQAPVAASAPRLQPVNSFVARLGPVAEGGITLADQFQLH